MKRYLLMSGILFILLSGCGTGPGKPYFVRNYELNTPKEATVGSVMAAWETGTESSRVGPFSIAKVIPSDTEAHGIRKEILYSGMAQGILHLTYRELNVENKKVNYAHPAFYQDLQYDLSGSDRITFQDLKIQIQHADSEKITYSVLQGPREIDDAKTEIEIREKAESTPVAPPAPLKQGSGSTWSQ